MIEFKADCGHTVRAKNEDEGKLVRCSYCGKDAHVPVQQVEDKNLDFLFREIEKQDPSAEGAAPPRKRKKGKAKNPFATSGSTFDPVSFAMKMGYAALILIIVIVLGKMVVPYVSRSLQSSQNASSDSGSQDSIVQADTTAQAPAMGLMLALDPQRTGLFVDSVPEGARIYVVSKKRKSLGSATAEGYSRLAKDILADPECDRNRRTRADVDIPEPGPYWVVCALAINSPGLKLHPNYRAFRQGVESGQAGLRVEQFLLPDKALYAGSTEFRDDFLVYRIYEVDVAPNQWSQVVALFLPPQDVKEILNYLPMQRLYAFDQGEARSEMSYYEFPKTDQSFLIQALERVGGMVYELREGQQQGYYWLSVTLGTGTVKIRPLTTTTGGRP